MEIEFGTPLSPFAALELAVQEGRKGTGFVSPNPLVGCVILDRDFKFLASGYHTAVGKPHAEIEALEKIQHLESLKGAHLFVTLEPCAHHGRTPPCAERLAQLPLASVTYGVQDPNPLVAGKGAHKVEQAGVAILNVQHASEIEFAAFFKKFGFRDSHFPAESLKKLQITLLELAEIFIHNMQSPLPFVALKIASSLDGQMALQSGESQWITGPEAREYAHYLRAAYDATLIGRNTLNTDNPSLNVRHPRFPNFRNRVVLIDGKGSGLKNLKDSRLAQTHRPEEIFVITQADEVSWLPSENTIELTTLSDSLCKLKERGVHAILVEGGAHTLSQFLAQNLVQRMYVFQAPMILGSAHGLSWTKNFGVSKMTDKVQLRNSRIEMLGQDFLVTGVVHAPASDSP